MHHQIKLQTCQNKQSYFAVEVKKHPMLIASRLQNRIQLPLITYTFSDDMLATKKTPQKLHSAVFWWRQ